MSDSLVPRYRAARTESGTIGSTITVEDRLLNSTYEVDGTVEALAGFLAKKKATAIECDDSISTVAGQLEEWGAIEVTRQRRLDHDHYDLEGRRT